MTTTQLLSELHARGVELKAHGDRLRFRPVDALGATEIESIREHKAVLLKLLRAEGLVCTNPDADPRPLLFCDRCGSTRFTDTEIHGGRSVRRDCARCQRFLGWPRWNDQSLDIRGPSGRQFESGDRSGGSDDGC